MNPFNAVAFVILMDHHREGVENAHPNYVEEKLQEFLLNSEEHSVALLDIRNQERLRAWCKHWSYPVPEELENWLNR